MRIQYECTQFKFYCIIRPWHNIAAMTKELVFNVLFNNTTNFINLINANSITTLLKVIGIREILNCIDYGWKLIIFVTYNGSKYMYKKKCSSFKLINNFKLLMLLMLKIIKRHAMMNLLLLQCLIWVKIWMEIIYYIQHFHLFF